MKKSEFACCTYNLSSCNNIDVWWDRNLFTVDLNRLLLTFVDQAWIKYSVWLNQNMYLLFTMYVMFYRSVRISHYAQQIKFSTYGVQHRVRVSFFLQISLYQVLYNILIQELYYVFTFADFSIPIIVSTTIID